jgi:hypothetical protein
VDRGDVGRERHQLVETPGRSVGVQHRLRPHLDHHLVGVPVNATHRELTGHDLVQTRTEGVDEARLDGRPGDRHPVAHALATQPGLEHEGELVERSGALVARRHQEQDVELLAPAGAV